MWGTVMRRFYGLVVLMFSPILAMLFWGGLVLFTVRLIVTGKLPDEGPYSDDGFTH